MSLTSFPLCRTCTWAYLLGSECNHRFSLWACVSRAAASTSEGWGYYYDYFWPLDWRLTLWLIFIRWIGSWGLIWVCHIFWGHGLEACIYTPSFFTVFSIQNHSLHLLGTFFSQKYISLLRHHTPLKMLIGGSEEPWGRAPLVSLGCLVPDYYQKLSSNGGESEQNILRVVGGIARRGRECVLVFMMDHKLSFLPLHPYLPHSEGSGRKIWGVIYHVFLHVLLLRGPTRRSLSLLVLSLTLVATCGCFWKGFG